MTRARVGRLPVVTRANPRHPIGILTRSDLLAAHQRRLEAARRAAPPPRHPAVAAAGK
jgi:hypothetical protein